MRRDAHIHAGLVNRAQERSTRRRKNQTHARGRKQIFFDRQHRVVHCVDVGSFGGVDVDVKLGFVNVRGNVFLFHDSIEWNTGERHRDRDYRNYPAMMHGQPQQPGVRTIDERIKTAPG